MSGVEVLSEKPRTGARGRLGVAREPREREAIRQCFLFSNHLLITTRTHAGRSVAVCVLQFHFHFNFGNDIFANFDC